ncbi:hypothetical protein [Streptomyces sp. NPDC014746]|uniref:hypothetical protein n=1 Tax=Streptomyces sp. NPDC014746 TaxID=3364904 RepID=UPI0036F88360
MVMLEAILATVTGLGGAGLGAAGALLVQRAKRRDDASAARTGVEQAEQARTLETIATARVAARAWLTAAQYMAADLQNGRIEEARRYAEQLESAYGEFVSALYRMPAHQLPRSTAPRPVNRPQPWRFAEPSSAERPFADELAEVSQLFREAFHQRAQPQMQQADLDSLQAQARAIYQRVTLYMGQRTAELTQDPFRRLGVLEDRCDATFDSLPIDTLLRLARFEQQDGASLIDSLLASLRTVMPPMEFERVESRIRSVKAQRPDLQDREAVLIALDVLAADQRDIGRRGTEFVRELPDRDRAEQAPDEPPVD